MILSSTQRMVLLCACVNASVIAFAQPTELKARIKAVEQNLFRQTSVVTNNSTLAFYNITDRMQHYKIPAVSVAVIHQGRLDWAKTYGLTNTSNNQRADNNTVFQAASVSKSLNALAIMQLVQQGRLSLDADIRPYLKTWIFPDNQWTEGKSITLRQLLSHTAGLNLHGFRGYTYDDILPTLNEILDGRPPANNEPLTPVADPGTTMEYSGGGTLVTRKILEDQISSNYDSLMQALVLGPLGMKNSTYQNPERRAVSFASAHSSDGKPVYGNYYIYPELAPDGLWTTASDLAKMILAIQQSLLNAPNAWIQPQLAKGMLTPMAGTNATPGFFRTNFGNDSYFMHTGANIGYRAIIIGGMSNGNGLVILTNSDNGEDFYNELINSVTKVYLWNGNQEPENRNIIEIPNNIQQDYAGIYTSERPKLKITVESRKDGLWMSTRSVDNLEKMAFISKNKFYLPSSPNTFASFLPGNGNIADTLMVQEHEQLLFKAIRTPDSIMQAMNIPGKQWDFVQNPERMGWNISKLGHLKQYLMDSTALTGYMIVHQGKVIFHYGDIQENSYIASCRKSVLSVLYGKYVKSGEIQLDQTLKTIGINDLQPLSALEKSAAIRDILAARSGIYHPASNQGDFTKQAPQRGTVTPGTQWLYNNWDFNVAGHIFEKLSRHNLYDELEVQLAQPLQMEDFDRQLQTKDGDLSQSLYPSYPMWLSTRDMARIGLMMLNKGQWGQQQIIDRNWVAEITTPRTSADAVQKTMPNFSTPRHPLGYGYMWWLWPDNPLSSTNKAFAAFGINGQSIAIFPAVNIVIAYKTKAAYERSTSDEAGFRALELSLQALELTQN